MEFYKYQGTGNDFVMIDDRNNQFPVDSEIVQKLCDRRFGIGADGLILLRIENNVFKMVYFNSDGNESTMCGNGGRCFVRFLKDLGLIYDAVTFDAVDGKHYAQVDDNFVKLQMQNVDSIQKEKSYYFLNTGSPHHVEFHQNISVLDVKNQGAEIRYSSLYPNGSNVNFVEVLTPNRLFVRTYERGVEDETYSCGTGVTAAALAYSEEDESINTQRIHIKTKGGNLQVSFEKENTGYKNIFLSGTAIFVFKGKIKI